VSCQRRQAEGLFLTSLQGGKDDVYASSSVRDLYGFAERRCTITLDVHRDGNVGRCLVKVVSNIGQCMSRVEGSGDACGVPSLANEQRPPTRYTETQSVHLPRNRN
jgi:hypothetical protein